MKEEGNFKFYCVDLCLLHIGAFIFTLIKKWHDWFLNSLNRRNVCRYNLCSFYFSDAWYKGHVIMQLQHVRENLYPGTVDLKTFEGRMERREREKLEWFLFDIHGGANLRFTSHNACLPGSLRGCIAALATTPFLFFSAVIAYAAFNLCPLRIWKSFVVPPQKNSVMQNTSIYIKYYRNLILKLFVAK